MQLELSNNEAKVLLHIVDDYYGSLRAEIYKTETPEAKDELREEEKIVKTLLDRLRAAE
jgi:hypothetical protein